MIKKGKFQIFSYLVDEKLIFYKDLSKKEVFLAFSIINTDNLSPIISVMNKCLIKRYIKYYSVQLNTKKSDRKIILNFEDITKDNIIKIFSMVRENLNTVPCKFRFLKDNELEREFFIIVSCKLNATTNLINHSKSFTIKDNNILKNLTFYQINLEMIDKINSFVFIFINFINNVNTEGYLVFNCRLDFTDTIKIKGNFVESTEEFENPLNLENKVNKLFNSNLIEKIRLKAKDIFKYLWRLTLLEKAYYIGSLESFFSNENFFEDIKKYSKLIEQNLITKDINYIKLNKNLLLINQKFLFLIIQILDPDLILKIIKNYHSKYYIYLLILDENDYKKLLEIEQIRFLEDFKIMNIHNFENFDYNLFKKEFMIKKCLNQ